MTKQYLVIGAGRFGTSVAKTLFELGHEVVVVDNDVARVQQISGSVTRAVQANATSEAGMSALGIRDLMW